MITLISLVFGLIICALCVLIRRPLGKSALPVFLVAFWHLTKVPFYVIAPIFAQRFIEQYGIEIGELGALLSIKIAVFVFFLAGYFVAIPNRARRVASFRSCGVGFFLWNLIFGLFFIFLYWCFIGGASGIIDSLSSRGLSTRGNVIFLSIGWGFLGLSVVCSIKVINLNIQLLLVIFLSALLFVSYGSRSLSGGMIVIWLVSSFIINEKIPIKIFSVGSLLAILAGSIVFTGAPLLRVQGAIDSYLTDGFYFLQSASENWFEILERFSIPEIEFLVLRHFDGSNYWWGSSFADLPYFFCPLSLCPDKPPIDEGVYLYNIFLYGEVIVGTPGRELELSSFPFETWSIWYANFGLFGVVLGGWIQGICLGVIYRFIFSERLFFRYIAAYSVTLIGIGFYNITNLSFGLFFFPLLLAIISAFCYTVSTRASAVVGRNSRSKWAGLARNESVGRNSCE